MIANKIDNTKIEGDSLLYSPSILFTIKLEDDIEKINFENKRRKL